MSEMYGTEAGIAAHRRGDPMSACPFVPSDPAGRSWRQGWIVAEAQAKHAAGTYGASAEDRAAAVAMTLADNGHDPVVEILGGYDFDRPTTAVGFSPEQWEDLARRATEMFQEMTAAILRFGQAVANSAGQIDSLVAAFGDALTKADLTWDDPIEVIRDRVLISDDMRERFERLAADLTKDLSIAPAPGSLPLPKRIRTTFDCRRHGPQPTSGFCRLCQRGGR